MKVIIVGAGLGGLSAALAFARKGHEVHLYERRPEFKARGNGITIRPNASRIMHTWGLRPDLEKIGEQSPSILLRNAYSGNIVMMGVTKDVSEHPDWGTWRDRVQEILYQRALEAGAHIVFGKSVEDVEEGQDSGTVIFQDGTQASADMILVADGIRSRIRPKVLADLGDHVELIVNEATLYGVRMPGSKLVGKPDAKRIIERSGVNVWLGKDGYVVSRYNQEQEDFSAFYALKSDPGDGDGLWGETGDIDRLRALYADTCPELKVVLREAETCDRWKLAELPSLPRWTSQGARVALLGDAAHAMLPAAAQGFSQIVEDIGVLEFLVQQSPKAAVDVPTILRTWEAIRKPRVDIMREYSRFNNRLYLGAPLDARRDVEAVDEKSLKDTIANSEAPYFSPEFIKWVQDYDAVGEAQKYLDRENVHL